MTNNMGLFKNLEPLTKEEADLLFPGAVDTLKQKLFRWVYAHRLSEPDLELAVDASTNSLFAYSPAIADVYMLGDSGWATVEYDWLHDRDMINPEEEEEDEPEEPEEPQ